MQRSEWRSIQENFPDGSLQLANQNRQSQITNHEFSGVCSGFAERFQNPGLLSGNATPASTVRVRRVPRKTTREACPFFVFRLVNRNFFPFFSRTPSNSTPPLPLPSTVC